MPGWLTGRAPRALVQLETLVGTLEDSFTSSEMVMSSSPASPRAMATLKAEKDRRQQLLRQLTQACLIHRRQPDTSCLDRALRADRPLLACSVCVYS